MATGSEGRPRLVRAIGRWDLTAAIVNGVVGSAIFGMPATLAALTGAWSHIACMLAGLGVLTIVLCFAEVASRFREAGGPYLYVREAFGARLGFQAGWLTFWVRVTALAANLNVFVDYLSALVPSAAAAPGRAAVMTLLVALIALVNVLGVREATWTINVFTLAKLSPLALLALLGLARARPEVLGSQAVADPQWTQAVLLLLFAYGGFEAPLIPAGEARDPRRDSAFALIVALALIAAVYMLVQLAIVGVVPQAARAPAPVAAALGLLLGRAGTSLAVVAAMVSVYGYSTGSMLQAPRLLYSMAARKELPAALARVHPRFRTPDLAILVFAAVSLAAALSGTFVLMATLSAVVRLVTYGLTCLALPVLRHRRPQEPPGFRLPAAALVAPAGSLFCVWLLATRSFGQAWLLVTLMAVGWGVERWVASARGPAPAGV